MFLAAPVQDYITRSYFPFMFQIIMAGDHILLASRKRVFLRMSLFRFQKSLEGWLMCIHKSSWLLLAWESAFLRAILAMCVTGHHKQAFAR